MLNKILSIILFILILPLTLIIFSLIFLIDGRPVFFTQKRAGINRTFFTLIKFRSMKINVNDVASHKIDNVDTLLSKTGPFIRKYSLDELPQLINIIKGDMNFIGPRPALYNQSDLINLRIQKGINKIKPGVTGWAQVNGRDKLSIEEKVIFEEYYLKNKSFYLDAKILLLTFKQLFIPDGVSH